MLQTNLESIYYIALKREKFLRYNRDINDNGEIYNIFNNLNEKIWNENYVKLFLLSTARDDKAKSWITNKNGE